MSDESILNEEQIKAQLLSELDQLRAQLRRRLRALVEHPVVSKELKSNPFVKEWVK